MPRVFWATLAIFMMMFAGCIRVPEETPPPPPFEFPKPAAATVALIPWPVGESAAADFTPLFNDKDLTGWQADPEAKFAVKEGAIVIESGKGFLRTEKAYQDFELHAEFRVPGAGADSGLFFRMTDAIRYQVQTKDADDLGEIRSAKVTQNHDKEATARVRKPVGEWQSFDVLVQGSECWVKLNGELVTYATGVAEPSGPIGIQAEGFPVEFRGLRVRNVK